MNDVGDPVKVSVSLLAAGGPAEAGDLLNVYNVLPVSHVNGPGRRAVVWVQGCSKRCPGCSNPLTHSHRPQVLLTPKRLAEFILTISGIEGLTITGGEPFEQAPGVGLLCRLVRKKGLSVMLYTGWEYKDICHLDNQAVRDLLDRIDILVDGAFIKRLADKDLPWRGSGNQQIRFLTDRYSPDCLLVKDQLQVEWQLNPGAPLQVTGFPGESDIKELTERLAAEAGILLEPTEFEGIVKPNRLYRDIP